MASITWIDLNGKRHKSKEYGDIKSFRSYIKRNRDSIRVVESLNCDPLVSLYDEGTDRGLFEECTNLIKVENVVGTLHVFNMSFMFHGCSNLESVPLFNTLNVRNMTGMFNGCPYLDYIRSMKKSEVHPRISEMYKYVWDKVK